MRGTTMYKTNVMYKMFCCERYCTSPDNRTCSCGIKRSNLLYWNKHGSGAASPTVSLPGKRNNLVSSAADRLKHVLITLVVVWRDYECALHPKACWHRM